MKQLLLQLSSGRNMLLVTFQHTIYNSQTPASFLRELPSLLPEKPPLDTVTRRPPDRQRKYAPHQYCSVTITSDLGDGAIGIVHGGKLEVVTSEGISHSCDAVIKLAFSEKQKERMRYEYKIYHHLAASNVAGISTVFGMFQDMDADGPLALLMNFGGIAIWRSRRSETDPEDVDIPQAER